MSASKEEVLDGCFRYGPVSEDEPGPVVVFRYKAREGDHADRAEDRVVRIISEVWIAKSTGKPTVRVVHVDDDGAPVIETVTRKDGKKVRQEATRTYRIERMTTAPAPLPA